MLTSVKRHIPSRRGFLAAVALVAVGAVVTLAAESFAAARKTCSRCSGSGQVLGMCSICGGSGKSDTGNSCQGCGGTGKRYKFCAKCDGTGSVSGTEKAALPNCRFDGSTCPVSGGKCKCGTLKCKCE